MVVHAAALAGGLGVSHMHRRARDGHAMGTAGVRSYGDHRLLDLLAEVLFGPARSGYSRRVHWVLTPGYSSALRRTCECRYAIANIRRRRSPGADAAGVGPVPGADVGGGSPGADVARVSPVRWDSHVLHLQQDHRRDLLRRVHLFFTLEHHLLVHTTATSARGPPRHICPRTAASHLPQDRRVTSAPGPPRHLHQDLSR